MKVLLTVGPMNTHNVEYELEVSDSATDGDINQRVREELKDLYPLALHHNWVRVEEP